MKTFLFAILISPLPSLLVIADFLPLLPLLDREVASNLSKNHSRPIGLTGDESTPDLSNDLLFSPGLVVNDWNDLYPSLSGSVYAIAFFNGSIYVAGNFLSAGNIPGADYIARWDNCQWHAVAPGMTGPIYEMAFIGGDIYVGGDFTDAGGNPHADMITMWDGTQWNSLGQGLNGSVFAIAGNESVVYVGGMFSDAGGNPDADRIAKWNGSSWTPLGTGLNDTPYSIVLQGGQVFAGGAFNDVEGNDAADYIAQWDGSSWQDVGNGLNGWMWNMAVNGSDIYMIGSFTQAGGNQDANYIARWTGTEWQNVGSYFQFSYYVTINAITIVDDYIYVGVSDESGMAWVMQFDMQNENWTEHPPFYPESAPIGAIAADANDIYVGNIDTNDDGGDGGGEGCDGAGGGFMDYHGSSRGIGGILRWGEETVQIYIEGVPGSICQIEDPIPLPTIQSGYSGNWSGPGVTSNIFNPSGQNGTVILTFSPTPGQCVYPAIAQINVIEVSIVFSGVPLSVCEASTPIVLPLVQSGIPGNWSGPGINDNTFDPSGLSGNVLITFTPVDGQCASAVSFYITINEANIPVISGIPLMLCENDTPILLPIIQNEITGQWSGPGVVNNAFNPSGLNGSITITFTPELLECVDIGTANIQVIPVIPVTITGVPDSLCQLSSAIALPVIQNGIQGIWSGPGATNNSFNPANMVGNITLMFTPDSMECAAENTTSIEVNPAITITITGVPNSLCQSSTPIVIPAIQNGIQGNWSGPGVSNNTFNPSGLNGNIVLTFTPDAGICALSANTSISVFQNTYIISGLPQSVCVTDPLVQLPPVQNGIAGNWSGPGVSSNTFIPAGFNGIVTLMFTPDDGQCASAQVQNIVVNPLVIPLITNIPNSICENSSPIPLLPVQNNIIGSWSGQGVTSNIFNPDGLNGNIILTFTPDAGQCALSNTAHIQVNIPFIPMISGVPTSVCEYHTPISLSIIQDGISGVWSGQGVSNNTFDPSGLNGNVTLTFTPIMGQCAHPATTDILMEPSITISITGTPYSLCQINSPIQLPTMQSGINGDWSGPGVINNAFNPNGLNGLITLFFNPDNGQCASAAEVHINVEMAIIPSLSGLPITLCQSDDSFILPTIQDGITGNWSGPGVFNNTFNPDSQNGTITLTYTPGNGQCAIPITTSIVVSPTTVPNITGIPMSLCHTDIGLILPKLINGITGNWSGQNVVSNVFDPDLLNGNYVLTFTPLTGQCAISATTQITVNTAPQFINLNTECDTTAQTYHVKFDIAGGDPSSYKINGNPITGSAFISSPFIADSTHYVFTLDDGNGCGPVLIEGSVNCACATYAGTMNYKGTPLKICEGADFTVPFNGDAKLDTDDLSAFVLHDNAGTLLGTIYATSNNTSFTFPSGIDLEKIYFISPIAGSNDGFGNINLLDPCLSVSQGIPIIFYKPQATISSGGIICTGECMTYTFQLSGEKPYELAYKVIANGMQTDQLLITDTNRVNIVICPQDFGIADGEIDIIPSSLTDANCIVSLTPFTGSQTLVRPASMALISETLCHGESLTVNGKVYDQFNPTGTQTIQNAEGCDSIIEIQLTFYPEAIHEINQTLCYGGSLVVNNTEYNESHAQGIEVLPGMSMNGCDSIIEIQLTFYPEAIHEINQTLCYGGSLVVNNTEYNESHVQGIEILQGMSMNGCDSIIEIQLTFYPEAIHEINQTLCYGGSLVVNNTEYNESHPQGTEVLPGRSKNGCDSIIEIDLEFDSVVMFNLYTTLCQGESIEINGNIYDEIHPQGNEIFPGGSVLGCDSLVSIKLKFYPESLSSLKPTLCSGDIVIINGTVFDESHTTGNEIIENGSVFGCDSIIQVTVTFIPEVYEFITDTLDAGESIIVNGTVYDQAHSQGIEILPDGSIAGCDSTIEIVLYFRKAISVLTEVVAPLCHGEFTGEILIKDINGGVPPYEVSIDGGSQITISLPPVILSGLNSGKHQVIIMDATSNQLIVEVEVPETPALEVDAGMDLSIKKGEDGLLDAKSSFLVGTWLWTPADFLTCTNCPDPRIKQPDHDVTYTLIVTDQNGCQASDEVLLMIREEDESDVYVPNVFSPNGDGVNDTWRIYSGDHQPQWISLSIFDQWGGILFNCVDKILSDSGVEWDGSMKGREMSPGVYVFVAVIEKNNGERIPLKGSITLIR